ncbi:hypothetical protein [Amycolatopsis sp. WGS_07]|uniref:hypothetical protein n=1 Tax=Amycolatopsis sp. WGS_07 TaxID=3076764 RepID=UPI003873A836
MPRRLLTGGTKPRAVSTALKDVLAHAEAALTQPAPASPAPAPDRDRSLEDAPADRDTQAGQKSAAAEPAPADAAQTPPVADLPMSDGRALQYRRVEAGEHGNRFAHDSYERIEPGRFRLVVASSPAEVPRPSGKPWTWFLHRIDADGKPRGAGLSEVRFSQKTHEYRTPQAALAEAGKWLKHLERHLDEPQLAQPSPVRGPIGELEFVPGWGDVSSQLKDQTLRGLPPAAQWALKVAWRLDTELPSPEREALWIRDTGQLPGNVRFPPEYVDEIAGYIGDLADHVAASGIPDALPKARRPIRLSDALREARDVLRPVGPTTEAEQPAPTEARDRREPLAAAAPASGPARVPATAEASVPAEADSAPVPVPESGPEDQPQAELPMSDGRALQYRQVEAGEKTVNRFAYDAYERVEPGRFSLVVKSSPAEVPPPRASRGPGSCARSMPTADRRARDWNHAGSSRAPASTRPRTQPSPRRKSGWRIWNATSTSRRCAHPRRSAARSAASCWSRAGATPRASSCSRTSAGSPARRSGPSPWCDG